MLGIATLMFTAGLLTGLLIARDLPAPAGRRPAGGRPGPPTLTRPGWTFGLRGWRRGSDGIVRTFHCDDPDDALTFLGEARRTILTAEQLARLRTGVRGELVQIGLLTPVTDPDGRWRVADAALTVRIDELGRPGYCPPLFGRRSSSL